MQITVDDPDRADVRALLDEHLADMYATSPAESVHALDHASLRHPSITFVTARDHDGVLLGCGALRDLGEGAGELKSMRTAPASRGRGVATAILRDLIDRARSRALRRVSLETGAEDYFAAARRLYRRHGFVDTAPFGGVPARSAQRLSRARARGSVWVGALLARVTSGVSGDDLGRACAMRLLFAVLRPATALAIVAAIVAQLIASVGFWRSRGVEDITVNVVNFFSFFTIDANLGSIVVGATGAYLLVARRDADPRWFQVYRACIVAYMATTGIVYNLLLRGIELPQGSTVGWSNEILHVIAPIYLVVDWLFAPGRAPLTLRTLRVMVIFPIVWAVYTLIRGPLVNDEVTGNPFWYPYPFLNPATSPEGYLSVAFYVALIAAVICLVGAGVIWLSRHLPADRPTTPDLRLRHP